jgi:hypothetical protein
VSDGLSTLEETLKVLEELNKKNQAEEYQRKLDKFAEIERQVLELVGEDVLNLIEKDDATKENDFQITHFEVIYKSHKLEVVSKINNFRVAKFEVEYKSHKQEATINPSPVVVQLPYYPYNMYLSIQNMCPSIQYKYPSMQNMYPSMQSIYPSM